MTFDLTTKNWQLPYTYIKTNNSPCGLWEIPNKANWAVDGGEVVLLISQAGANGSTSFIDTAKSKVITPTNAIWSNTQLLFGKPTIYCNNGYLRINGGVDFNIATGQPFCIEFWMNANVRHASYGSTQYGSNQIWSSNAHLLIHATTTTAPSATLMMYQILTITVPNIEIWNHYAFSRTEDGNFRIFVNGQQKGLTNTTTLIDFSDLFIGREQQVGATYSSNSYFAEIRITKGVPIYTQNFTTPNAGFV